MNDDAVEARAWREDHEISAREAAQVGDARRARYHSDMALHYQRELEAVDLPRMYRAPAECLWVNGGFWQCVAPSPEAALAFFVARGAQIGMAHLQVQHFYRDEWDLVVPLRQSCRYGFGDAAWRL